ncbi:MAG TPA: hypothetical protein PK272_06550 [Methanoregulaceae archaeon]|nr:hypothetical protein [Methanoregulaceae archaeon]HNI42316.1 hypothetical protein [Methanoregulaceae archaeon]HNJ80777.1 hypothetical protein [Methanoregulaceae archaeon]
MDHPFTDEERAEIRAILIECLKEIKAEQDRQEEKPNRGDY